MIAQDTGFGRRLPAGAGLFAFTHGDDVVAAVEELERDYERHRAAARELAVEHLDSDRVLGSLLGAPAAVSAACPRQRADRGLGGRMRRPREFAASRRRPYRYATSAPLEEVVRWRRRRSGSGR